MSRHSSIDALRERYQKTRQQWPTSSGSPLQDGISQKPPSILSSSPVTTVYEEEEEEEEEEDEREDGFDENENEDDDNYSAYSSSSSIPDENIDFDLIYALHTFVATTDGQASVVKGDAMILMDDSNSYWWLVKALKTAEVGYIPAENIETPFERLARLNKHRNVEVTSLDQLQFFRSPLNKAPTKGKKKKVQLSKNLECQVQIILTTEGNEGAYEEAFEEWKEEMPDTIFDESDTEDMEEDEREATPVIVDPIIDQHLKDGTPVTPTTKREPTKPLLNLEENSFSQNHMETVGETTPPPPTPPHQTNTQEPQYLQQSQQPQKQVSGLRRLFSLGKKDKPENLPKIDTTSNATTSLEEAENNQYHVLRIFSGNINVGALFNTVAVTPDMNADQLLKLALQKFHIPLIENSNRSSLNGIEYFLTVKSMDSDEITLSPQDKPLEILESLSDHLTTPMPSLTYIKRLSQEQPTIKVTRVGVSKARQRAKARFGEDSVIRFSLHKRIKRTIDNAGGQVYVKISYYASSIKQKKTAMETHAKLSGIGLIRKSSLLRMDPQTQHQLNSNKSDQERIDKLVAISTTTKISELTQIALEKFHLPKDEEDTSYCMTLSVSGKEKNLPPERTLLDIINDTEMIPKGTIEKLFVLQKISNAKMQNSTGEIDGNSTNGSRFVRYLLKQDNASNSKPVQNNTEDISSTGNVLKRLDEAILSLENDKRKLDKVCSDENISLSPTLLNEPAKNVLKPGSLPVRSNSLSHMSRRRSPSTESKENKPTSGLGTPMRSSSLKLSRDAFDTESDLSNMDELAMEIQRIASSHAF